MPESIREASILTRYAVRTRYPGLPEEVGEEEYTVAVALAEEVYRWAESILTGGEGGGGCESPSASPR